MKWKELVADYFNFTRKGRIGYFIILLILLIIALSPYLFTIRNGKSSLTADTAWITAAKKLEHNDKSDTSFEETDLASTYQFDPSKASRTGESLFFFDPNTLDKDGWQKLGLREKTTETILKYRNKGGQFRKPEDLQRIYGLRKSEFNRLAPYIRIQDNQKQKEHENYTEDEPVSKNNTIANRFLKKSLIIDINSADTTAFIELPGIGRKLAARIINFRDKLGGFYRIEQIGETFGLPDSTFQKIKPYLQLINISIRKININTATVEDLKAHPYIKYTIANPVIAYRNEHGPFSRIEDIKKVMAVTNELYDKISPYLIAQ